MGPDLESVISVMLDRSPQAWVAGIVVALFLALALAGAHMLIQRRTKAEDGVAPLVGISVIAIFAGMIIAEADAALNGKSARVASRGGTPQGGPGSGPGAGRGPGPGGGGRRGGEGGSTRLAGLIMQNADTDHDGRVSAEEAATAAAKFITDAGESEKGGLDRDALAAILRERMRSSGGGGGGAPRPGAGASGVPPVVSGAPPVVSGAPPVVSGAQPAQSSSPPSKDSLLIRPSGTFPPGGEGDEKRLP